MSNIDQKVDKILDTLTDQAVTLERLTVTVEDHVRRTNLLEDEIKPLKVHVNMVQGALKLIALLGIAVTIMGVLVSWIRH